MMNMGRKKQFDSTIRIRIDRDSYERFKEICAKADTTPSEMSRKMIEAIISLNVNLIQKLTPENVKWEYDKSRAIFKMTFEGTTIEMDMEKFLKVSRKLQKEYTKITDKLLKQTIKEYKARSK